MEEFMRKGIELSLLSSEIKPPGKIGNGFRDPVHDTGERDASPYHDSTGEPPREEELIPPTLYCRWVEKTYGDTGKTKTVTRKKYNRIIAVLRGQELPSAENGRFRFWIKGKNFKLAPAAKGQPDYGRDVLYVPVKSTESDGTIVDRGYKRVAVVEDFYAIIHSVHVGTDSRNGKHAGQKRTYRAVAENYAFLPREAVTRFLMSCSECQKRMHLTFDMSDDTKDSTNGSPACGNEVKDIDYNLPITTTYLNHLRNMRITQSDIKGEVRVNAFEFYILKLE